MLLLIKGDTGNIGGGRIQHAGYIREGWLVDVHDSAIGFEAKWVEHQK